jgi:hypothetical protein
MNTYENRGTGRTTRQIQALPDGWCLFIVPTERQTVYTRALAEHLGRPALDVRTIRWLEAGGWQGLRPQGVAVDHYTWEHLFEKRLPRTHDVLRVALDYWRAAGVRVL